MSIAERTGNFPKIFADTSLADEIKKLMELELIDGITTNPIIVAKQIGNEEPESYYKRLTETFPGMPLSIQLLDNRERNKRVDILVKEGLDFAKISPDIVIKVPMLGDGRGLAVLAHLSREGIKTNITALMKKEQLLLALLVGRKAGKEPAYVSLFFNRIRDRAIKPGEKPSFDAKIHGSGNPSIEIRKSRSLIDMLGVNSQIIVGSIRSGDDVFEAVIAGTHIVTIQPEIIEQMIRHNKSDEFSVDSTRDFEKATTPKNQ